MSFPICDFLVSSCGLLGKSCLEGEEKEGAGQSLTDLVPNLFIKIQKPGFVKETENEQNFSHTTAVTFFFYWSIVDLQCKFQVYSKVN